MCYYLPLRKVGPFIWTNLNLLHPEMLCAKFGWNWPSGSGVEDFSLFRYHIHLEKVLVLNLNKLELISHKDALYLIWLKLTRWFWRRRRKFVKFMTTTTTRGRRAKDKLWSEKLAWALNSAQVSLGMYLHNNSSPKLFH